MEELFGLSMNWIMAGLLALLAPSLLLVSFMAWRNPVILKLGLRNIPRRKAQTALIIVGVMISTLIMAAAFGTGDTINFSIRSQAIDALGPIDEIVVSARTSSEDRFGSNPYFSYARFLEVESQLSGLEQIDGLAAGIGEEAPAVNLANFRAEGNMRVAGVDPVSLTALGGIRSTTGDPVALENLAADEIYINQAAAEELEARPGDTLRLMVSGKTSTFVVNAVVSKGGLAGDQPTVIIPLSRAQTVFGKAGQVNSFVISNRGDENAGVDLSDEVTLLLRVLFADRAVAAELQSLLQQEKAVLVFEAGGESLGGSLGEDIFRLLPYLRGKEPDDQLLGILTGDGVAQAVVTTLAAGGLEDLADEANRLFTDLAEFRVVDIKRQVLEAADEAASQVTTIFIVLGLFSIMVGVLLIFLIFVMVAAARRPEMGMARAVGAKRRHLIWMFVFEGTSYSLISAAVGVAAGLGISAVIVLVANQFIRSFEEDLQFVHHIEVRSAIVAYCLGILITLGTVAFSAYRVSRMNIVAAIRGLPEAPASAARAGWGLRLSEVGRSLVRPLLFGNATAGAIADRRSPVLRGTRA